MIESVMIVGVGGQGTLLASRIIGNLMLSLGNDVKMSEVHGMAQRGGSVVTHVRYGDKVHAPLIDVGGADYILAFEKLEALRAYPYLKTEGQMIVNSQEIFPMPVILGAADYPKDTLQNHNVLYLDALSLAKQAGSVKTVNVVLIGVLASMMPEIPEEKWREAIEKTVKPKFVEMNQVAFGLGYHR